MMSVWIFFGCDKRVGWLVLHVVSLTGLWKNKVGVVPACGWTQPRSDCEMVACFNQKSQVAKEGFQLIAFNNFY